MSALFASLLYAFYALGYLALGAGVLKGLERLIDADPHAEGPGGFVLLLVLWPVVVVFFLGVGACALVYGALRCLYDLF